MSDNEINNDYLCLTYKFVRLLDERKKIWVELLDYEDGFKAWDSEKKDSYVVKLKNKVAQLDQTLAQMEESLSKIIKRAQDCGVDIPFEVLVKQYKLSKEGKYILMTLYYNDLLESYRKLHGRDLLFMLGYKPSEFIQKSTILAILLSHNLIKDANKYPSPTASILEIEHCLTPITMQRLAGDRPLYMNDLTQGVLETSEPVIRNSVLLIRSPLITFDQIILDDNKKHEINKVIYQAEKSSILFSKWGFDKTIKYGKGMTMLFSGAPGTGKTASCEAIAHRLGKKIGIANYAKLIDMWVGNSEKNIVMAFEQAKQEDCVLVFDEADTLFSKRQGGEQRHDRMYDFMSNILMQELERFEGICILTTNRDVVMDNAFKRRILLKLKFDVPAAKERIKIWQTLIPPTAPIDTDVNFEEIGHRFALTGGEIKNVILNVIRECSYRNEQKITMAVLTEYAEREMATSVKQATKKYGFLSQ